jgi:ADP-heptose:LPS heptosyltransferase
MWRTTGLRLSGTQRIVVVRAGGIGDLIFALPALKSLKATYPDAELTLLAADWQGAFLAGRGIVDCVIEMPAYKGVRGGAEDPSEIARFFERMRAERFDLAIQMHGGGRNSNPFTRRLGARTTLGLQTPDAEALDINVPYVYLQPEVFRFLELAAAVGCEPVELEPSLPILPSDLEPPFDVARLVDADGSLVLLSPGASDPRRRWPVERFAAVAKTLVQEDAKVVVVGAEEDRPLADTIREQVPEAVSLTGAIGLNHYAGLASRADVLIGNDSGPLNLARAVGTATVGIYWVGNMINAGGPTRSRQRPLASWQVACPECGTDMIYRSCEHAASFVAQVGVEEVLFNALDLLGRRPVWPSENEGA